MTYTKIRCESRQQAAASTNFVGCFLLVLFYFFSLSSVGAELPYWSQHWAFGPNNIFLYQYYIQSHVYVNKPRIFQVNSDLWNFTYVYQLPKNVFNKKKKDL